VFALSGLGGENDVSSVKSGGLNKNVQDTGISSDFHGKTNHSVLLLTTGLERDAYNQVWFIWACALDKQVETSHEEIYNYCTSKNHLRRRMHQWKLLKQDIISVFCGTIFATRTLSTREDF